MSTNVNYIESVQKLVRAHGSVERAWQAYRESYEYFDGEVEIEEQSKRAFYAAAGWNLK